MRFSSFPKLFFSIVQVLLTFSESHFGSIANVSASTVHIPVQKLHIAVACCRQDGIPNETFPTCRRCRDVADTEFYTGANVRRRQMAAGNALIAIEVAREQGRYHESSLVTGLSPTLGYVRRDAVRFARSLVQVCDTRLNPRDVRR